MLEDDVLLVVRWPRDAMLVPALLGYLFFFFYLPFTVYCLPYSVL